MIGVYVAGRTPLHRVAFGWKLAGLAALALALGRVGDWRLMALACAATLALTAALGPAMRARLADLRPLWPMLAMIGALQWAFEGSAAAALVTLRLVTLVALANLVAYTTQTSEMLETLETLFSPLRWIGLSPRAPALAVALTLRLVPMLLALWEEKAEAWRARTGRRASARLIPTFLAEALALADALALALDARGYSLTHRPSPQQDRSAR